VERSQQSVGHFGDDRDGLGRTEWLLPTQNPSHPSTTAVATNVFVVAITAMTASIGQFSYFLQEGGTALATCLVWLAFTVPGVIIGGQIGAYVAKQISQHALERFLAVVFALVAAILLRDALPSVTNSLNQYG
jgi:zinc transporter ZupT